MVNVFDKYIRQESQNAKIETSDKISPIAEVIRNDNLVNNKYITPLHAEFLKWTCPASTYWKCPF
jgi:hypothetical protein